VSLKDELHSTLIGLSPDGALLAIGDGEVIKLFRVDGGELLRQFGGGHGDVGDIVFGVRGRLLVSFVDGATTLWDVDGNTLGTWVHSTLLSSALSADARKVAIGTRDGHVEVQDVDGQTPPVTKTFGGGAVWSVKFSNNGARVAAALQDGVIHVWATDDPTEDIRLIGHSSAALSAVFSPDGALVASASMDGTVRLWDAAHGRLLAMLSRHVGMYGASNVVFRSDGHQIFSTGDDGTLQIWRVPSFDGNAATLNKAVECHVPFGLKDGDLVVNPQRNCATKAQFEQ
jgi:WD40 repeat protein